MSLITPPLREHWLTVVLAINSVLWGTVILLTPNVWQINLLAAIGLFISGGGLWLHHYWAPTAERQAIAALTQQIDAKSTHNFNALSTQNLPREMHPLIDTLNHFLHRETEQSNQEHNFTSQASHELRTPLAGMRLQAQLAQRTNDPAQREKALGLIIKAIDRTTYLVEQLLTLSRYSHLQQELNPKAVTLLTLCQQLASEHQKTLTQRNIQLDLNCDPTLPPLSSFDDAIEVLIKNLFTNAVRHTPNNGIIRINNELLNPHRVRISVADSGPGIPKNEYTLVQMPFQKASDGQKRGTGLGLAIASRIAELHGSKLTLESADLGGLEVSVSLPVANNI